MKKIVNSLINSVINEKILVSFFSVIALCCFNSVKAQRDPIWYFGNRAGLNFASGAPLPLTNNAINTYEGTSTICDSNGQLLFYTNGMRVLDRNHVIMPNGNDLKGGSSSTQSALILTNPVNPNRYYIFTADEFVGEGIYYSEVDMTANNGLGDVVVKNVLLLTEGCEKLAAVTHTNGIDTWVVGHQWNSNAFYAWRVSTAGIAPPVVSNTGSVIIGPIPYIASAGQMKFSPDGTRLVSVNTSINTQLFDFDSATGTVSNPLTLMTGYQFGAEFSPSGNALYINEASLDNSQIFQFDLNASDVIGSITQINSFNSNLQWGMLDLGPDSKIYVASYGSNSLSIIDQPDVIGTGCNLVPLSRSLAGRTTFYGLPTFFQPGLYITAVNTIGNCVGSAIIFSADITKTPDSIYWDFGDNTFSTELQPSHLYMLPGTYTVKVKVRQNGYERYFTKIITVLPNPSAVQPTDWQLCDDESNDGQAVFDLASQQSVILGGQSPQQFTVTFYATVTDAVNGINALPLTFTNTTNPQTIYAKVNSVSDCYALTSFTLSVVRKPVVDMPLEYWLCAGSSLTLTAPSGYSNYLWSTQETTGSIVVAQPGIYTVTVIESGVSINCDTTLTITVRESTTPIISDIAIIDWTDNNNSITIIAQGNGNYEYSIDGIVYQDLPTFTELEPGKYTVHVRDKNGCGSDREEVVLLMYPSFFTPNGDGINDYWVIKHAYLEPQMNVQIFDRFGKLITSFNGNGYGWDGEYQGRELPSTDYWFVVTRGNGKEKRGHFSMLR